MFRKLTSTTALCVYVTIVMAAWLAVFLWAITPA